MGVDIQKKVKRIKCVIWDLDNTIWDGTLIEEKVTLRKNIIHTIKTLDERGILQSISSRNEYGIAMHQLKKFGIDEYFIFPQINWGNKSASISKIARVINIGMDTIAFIDDQAFERGEISHEFPDVLCIDALEVDDLLDRPEFSPEVITVDAKNRRKIYMADIKRNEDESNFDGTNENFLKTLDMKLTLFSPKYEDLERAKELTLRTNQLNATGYTYSIDELYEFTKSDKHMLLMAELSDVYGSHGKVGLVLVEKEEEVWTLKLLLMSCRVMSRGIGSIILNKLINHSINSKVKLLAEFIPTERNRKMYVTYKFAGFSEIKSAGPVQLLENKYHNYRDIPDYIGVNGAI